MARLRLAVVAVGFAVAPMLGPSLVAADEPKPAAPKADAASKTEKSEKPDKPDAPKPASPEAKGKAPDKPAAPAGPETAVAALEAAAKAGDLDAVLGIVGDPVAAEVRGLLAASAEVSAAGKRLGAAIDAKFPAAQGTRGDLLLPADAADRLRENLRRTVSMVVSKKEKERPEPGEAERWRLSVVIVEREDKALGRRTRNETYAAVRAAENGPWRLLLADPDKDARQRRDAAAALKTLPAALDRLAAQVAEGKFKSREEAAQALNVLLVKSFTRE
jgi:hypothetical protein